MDFSRVFRSLTFSEAKTFAWYHVHALLRCNDRRSLGVTVAPYYYCHISNDTARELLQLVDGCVSCMSGTHMRDRRIFFKQ